MVAKEREVKEQTLESHRGQPVVNYSTDNQTRRGTTHDSNLLKFMGLVENEAKQDRANHTAQDDSQSYSATIFLFALGKSKRLLYIFGFFTN
jgi:hypothetical protein